MKAFSKLISCLLLAFLCVTLLTPDTATAATVQQGSTGSSVKYIQYNLNFLGYNAGTVDGICGSKTVKAIKNYQADHNLTVDGIAGNATQSALTSEVKSIQKLLKNKGYYTGSLDGIAGANTVSALKKFQKANDLTQSGVANSSTLKLLKKSTDNSSTSKAYASSSGTLKIGSGNYNPGTLNVGSSYSISGKITSNYKITSVTVGVYNDDGSATAQVKTVKPNAKSYNISKVDSYIKFGKLSSGSYVFKVTAKDASGSSKTLVKKDFTVKNKSNISIGYGQYSPGTLTVGSSYSISGQITSNYKITYLTVGIYNQNGAATSQVKTVLPNSKSYNISNVDSYIKFGKLSAGSYIFKVTAQDASGASKTLVKNSFTVKAKSSTSSNKYSSSSTTTPIIIEEAVNLAPEFKAIVEERIELAEMLKDVATKALATEQVIKSLGTATGASYKGLGAIAETVQDTDLWLSCITGNLIINYADQTIDNAEKIIKLSNTQIDTQKEATQLFEAFRDFSANYETMNTLTKPIISDFASLAKKSKAEQVAYFVDGFMTSAGNAALGMLDDFKDASIVLNSLLGLMEEYDDISSFADKALSLGLWSKAGQAYYDAYNKWDDVLKRLLAAS